MDAKLLTADRFVDSKTQCSYRYVLSSTEYFRPHYHDYYEIFVMLDGKAKHCVNGNEIPLTKGNMVFIRPNDTHDYICEKGTTFSMMNITITANTINDLFLYLGEGFPSESLKSLPLPPSVHLSDSDLEWFNQRMDGIMSINSESHDKIKTALRMLLFRIFTRFFADISDNETEMPLWLNELLDSMQHNGNFIIGLDRLLEMTPKTREHTLRSIKKHTGITATEYINTLRLNYVANMLRNSNHNISDIIFESGFNNISWASTLFREKFGMSMREYRNNE